MSAIRRVRPYALLFVGLSLIYHSNLRPVASGDSLPAALLPFSILIDHTLTLDRFGPYLQDQLRYDGAALVKSQGHWYSAYPVAGPVLATPLYLPALAFPSLARESPLALIVIARIAEKFVAVFLAAGASVGMLLLIERLVSQRWAWGLTLAFALATATWSTASQALWQHTFGEVALVVCLYGLTRWEAEGKGSRSIWIWVCGAGAGVALAVRPTNVWLLPAIEAALFVRRAPLREYARLLTPMVLAVVPVEAFNWAAFGKATGGYWWIFDGDFVSGLAGLLASPGRGLLVYTPLALFALAVLMPAARPNRQKHRSLLTACAIFSALHLLTIAKWHAWWGGYCWGPRLLTEMVAPLVVLIAIGSPALQARSLRLALVAVTLYGFGIQALGVYFYPKGRWDRQPRSVDSAPQRLWDWTDNPVVRTARGGPAWEPYAVVSAALSGGIPAAAHKLQDYGIRTY